jgi:hypothetical protein
MKKLKIQHLIITFILSGLMVAFGCNTTLAREGETNGNSDNSGKPTTTGKNTASVVKAQGAPDKTPPPNSKSEENRGGKPLDVSTLENSNRGGKNLEASGSSLPVTDDGFSPRRGKPPKGALLSLDGSEGSGSGESTKPGKLKKLLRLQVIEGTGSADASGSAALSKRRAIQGVISSLSGDLMTLSHQIHRDRLSNILITGAQIFQPKTQGATASATLQVGQRVIVFGDLNGSGQLVAKRIRIIPGKATGVFNKNPLSNPSGTPSALPSASSSASPSATPEPSASASAEPTAAP